VCPSSTSIQAFATSFKGHTALQVGAQNIHSTRSGAFTGSISGFLAKQAGAEYVIVGHSERRAEFDETNKEINNKLKQALINKLTPIVCVGDSLKQKRAGLSKRIIKEQVVGALHGIHTFKKLLICYEPVWAISSHKGSHVDALKDIIEHITYIKQVVITTKISKKQLRKVLYIYGGSVNKKNAKQVLGLQSTDGVLVGAASISISTFVPIVKATV